MRSGPIPRFGLIAGLTAIVLGGAAADSFLVGIEDMPLMTGLVQRPDRASIFDSPAGRIVEAYAEGRVSRDGVLSFYERTLPQLGWQQTSPGVFRREGEMLRLEFPGRPPAATAGPLTVRFYLSPG